MYTNSWTTAAHSARAPHLDASTGRRLGDVPEPYARLEVEVGTPTSTLLHHGWVDRTSTLVIDRGEDGSDVVEIDVAFVPAAIAELAGLRPRPRLEGRGGPVDPRTLDALMSPVGRVVASGPSPEAALAAESLAEASGPWPAVAACLRTGAWRLCLVDVADSRGGSTSTEQVIWVDTPAGLIRVVEGVAGPVLAGTTTAEIWHSLLGVLPVDPNAVAETA